ncbi:MAG: hypothetical protein ACFB20_12390 [Opitutales bacterium]
MTTGGLIILVLSVGGVTLLFLWCIFKVLTTPSETAHVHGFEQETPDEKAEFEAEKIKEANRRKATDTPFPGQDSDGGSGKKSGS